METSKGRKVWSREDLLRASGIKPEEWPMGWFLWGPPHYQVSPVKEPQRKRFQR
jgi:hypothetical protein